MIQRLLSGWRARAAVFVSAALFIASAGILAGSAPTFAAAQPSCSAAGSTGLTAKVVATAGQTITGAVDATGCDVGIFVGPGANHVTIDGVHVSGANDHGIFVQDARGIIIEHSVVEGNGLHSHWCSATHQTIGCIKEDKQIELVGTSHGLIQDNVVTGNHADGGIGISDDGPLDPGAITSGHLSQAYHNIVVDNMVSYNETGCGIVVSAYNPGAGVSNNVVEDNVSHNNHAGITVAAVMPKTIAIQNDVYNNVTEDNTFPGIIVHSNASGDVVSLTRVQGNTMVGNGPDEFAAGGHGPRVDAGMVVVAEAGSDATLAKPVVKTTTISGNVFAQESLKIFYFNATGTRH